MTRPAVPSCRPGAELEILHTIARYELSDGVQLRVSIMKRDGKVFVEFREFSWSRHTRTWDANHRRRAVKIRPDQVLAFEAIVTTARGVIEKHGYDLPPERLPPTNDTPEKAA